MKVLICIATLGRGGAERQVRLLVPALAAANIEVGLFARLGGDDIRQMESAGAVCFPIRARHNHDLALFRQFREIVGEFKPDVVQTFLSQMDLVAGLSLNRGIPWILCERTSLLHYRKLKGLAVKIKESVRATVGRRADMVVANSCAGLDVWPHARLPRVIPNALVIPPCATEARAGHASRNGAARLVTISRLVDTKRIDTLVRAVAQLTTSGVSMTLDIVGDGPERSNLEALVEALQLTDRVWLHGERDDVERWLGQADAFVSASLYEGQPNAVLEAAAAGVPLILSDIPEHREAMAEGAFYGGGGDPSIFAQTIAGALREPAEMQNRVRFARHRIADRSPGRIAESYIAAYRDLVAV